MIDEPNILSMKYEEIIKKFNDITIDKLKDICRDNDIVGFSTLNKPELICLITKTYNLSRTLLCKFNYTNLLDICKTNELLVQDCKGKSKDMLIHIIISSCDLKNKIIKHDAISEKELSFNIKTLIENHKEKDKEKDKEFRDEKKNDTSLPNGISNISINQTELDEAKTKLDELRKEKIERENLIKTQEKILEDKIKEAALEKKRQEKAVEVEKKRQEKAVEVEKKRQEKAVEVEKKRQEKEAEAEKKRQEKEAEAEKKRQEKAAEPSVHETTEKPKTIFNLPSLYDKKKSLPKLNDPPPYEDIDIISSSQVIQQSKNRKTLPSSVRDSIWNHYIGEDINKHRCLCCKKVLITNRKFEVGHVISVKEGGTDEINNLRPICSPCNHSMGTKNMIEFVKTYGYYIG